MPTKQPKQPTKRKASSNRALGPEIEERSGRVREHSEPAGNHRIDVATQESIDRCIRHGRKAIVHRLALLEREWDMDRVLMTNFAAVGGVAYGFGLRNYSETRFLRRGRKGLLYLVGAQLGFLMMHAAIGWCPPVALFRRLGIRTRREIESERAILLDALESHGLVHEG